MGGTDSKLAATEEASAIVAALSEKAKAEAEAEAKAQEEMDAEAKEAAAKAAAAKICVERALS